MQIYASMLEAGLRGRGHEVRLLQPPAILGARVAETSPLFKWSGYADKFLLFRRELRRAAQGVDIVHLCDHSNAMYVPSVAHKAHVITCHDVLAIRSAMRHFPENPVGVTGRTFQQLIARGLRQAQAILCVSRKTRDDLHRYLGVPEERLHVVPNALPWPYKPMTRDVCTPLLRSAGVQPGEQYFFHIGGNHWYKNRGAAIQIFAELRKLPQYGGTKLVMAGGPLTAALREIAERHQVDQAVVEAVGLSNECLQALYSCALATLFPSLEEGFGWPILEAAGLPMPGGDDGPAADERGSWRRCDPDRSGKTRDCSADGGRCITGHDSNVHRRPEKCGGLFRRTDAREMRGLVSRGCGRGPNAQALSGFSSRRSCKFIAVYSEPMYIKTEGS